MSQVTLDHETKLSAHELIMYRNGLSDYLKGEECPSDKRSRIEKEIYYTNLLIEVRTIQAFRIMGTEKQTA